MIGFFIYSIGFSTEMSFLLASLFLSFLLSLINLGPIDGFSYYFCYGTGAAGLSYKVEAIFGT
jgi:hypothetical protein